MLRMVALAQPRFAQPSRHHPETRRSSRAPSRKNALRENFSESPERAGGSPALSPRNAQGLQGAEVRPRVTVGNPYGFTGRRFDGETGLWYFRARYFDSELGRFIGRDPLDAGKPAGGYHDGMSLYRGWFVPNELDPIGMVKVVVGKCEIKIIVGHNSKSDPIEIETGPCSRAGAVVCWPAGPMGTIPVERRLRVPTHNHSTYNWSRRSGDWQGTANDILRLTGDVNARPGDPEYDARLATDDAYIDAVHKANDELCGCDCASVNIMIVESPHGMQGRLGGDITEGWPDYLKPGFSVEHQCPAN